MQEFFINKDATLPILKMELLNDGRTDFDKFFEMIQNSTITFSMEDIENGILNIANEPALLLPKDGCGTDEYFICYKWRVRDTKQKGRFKGVFKITFGDVYGGGTLLVPIQEELVIVIQ